MNSPSPFGGGPDLSQIFNVLQNIVTAIANLQGTVSKIFPLGLRSSATWNPGTIAAGAQVTTTVSCAGAALGMSAQAAFSLDIHGLTLSAYVSAANTVTVVLYNGTVAGVTLASGTATVWARSN